MLAFVLGKGFGKPDLWSKESTLPLFLAARPLSNADWIGAKLKAAAVAAVVSWLVVGVMTTLWLWIWCDCQMLGQLWELAKVRYTGATLYAMPLLLTAILVVLTWRFLAGSLYLGLCGKPWVLNFTACGVFIAIFGSIFGMIPFSQNPNLVYDLLHYADRLPWILGSMLTVKIIAAALLVLQSKQRALIAARSVGKYLTVWMIATATLILTIWMLIPAENTHRWTFILLALIATPLTRVSLAPWALAQNRWR